MEILERDQEYSLDNPDDIYLLAFKTAERLRLNQDFMTWRDSTDFPWTSNDPAVRAAWDMGMADGFGYLQGVTLRR